MGLATGASRTFHRISEPLKDLNEKFDDVRELSEVVLIQKSRVEKDLALEERYNLLPGRPISHVGHRRWQYPPQRQL